MVEPPSNIRALQAEQILELTWDDQRVSRLQYHTVRGECPCASCRDEWTGKRILDPATLPRDLKIEGMEPIGNYAVRFTWSDNHSSGLFTWEQLRRIADEHPLG